MKLTLAFLRCIYIKFSDNFFNYRKTLFHVNGVNNYFIILCIFPNISFWRQSLFFPSFFWNQNRLGFKKILEIKLSDKSIVSTKGWQRNKGKPQVTVCLHNFQLFWSFFPAILVEINNTGVQYFLFRGAKLFWRVKQ